MCIFMIDPIWKIVSGVASMPAARLACPVPGSDLAGGEDRDARAHDVVLCGERVQQLLQDPVRPEVSHVHAPFDGLDPSSARGPARRLVPPHQLPPSPLCSTGIGPVPAAAGTWQGAGGHLTPAPTAHDVHIGIRATKRNPGPLSSSPCMQRMPLVPRPCPQP